MVQSCQWPAIATFSSTQHGVFAESEPSRLWVFPRLTASLGERAWSSDADDRPMRCAANGIPRSRNRPCCPSKNCEVHAHLRPSHRKEAGKLLRDNQVAFL